MSPNPRRIRRGVGPAPAALETCGECSKKFKGTLDQCWWNDDDPARSRFVCNECYFALAEKKKVGARAAANESAAAAMPTPEMATALMRERLLAIHTHKWVHIGTRTKMHPASMYAGDDNYEETFLFTCSECPLDPPPFRELKPS